MIIDEYRQEVAKRFWQLARDYEDSDVDEVITDEVDYEILFEFVCGLFDAARVFSSQATLSDLAKTLSTLINLPTCNDIGGEEGTNGEHYDFACNRCGFCSDITEPNYCPNCGAEVVE